MIHQCDDHSPIFSIQQSVAIEKRNEDHLLNFTKACWDLYSQRLNSVSNDIFKAGELEYRNNNKFIISKILEIGDPIKVSLSVTTDGSLHYTFRFKNGIVLFIETFLYLTEENHTYIEAFENDELIFSGHEKIETGIALIKEKLGIINRDSSLYNSSLFSYSLNCD